MQNTVPSEAARSTAAWKVLNVAVGSELADVHACLHDLRLRTFRILAAFATTALFGIVARELALGGGFPWADVANATSFAVLLGLSLAKPQWLRGLYWLGLVSLFGNALDGLHGAATGTVTPYLVLLPLLVLYGALLGDLWVTLLAMLGVTALYANTWFCHVSWTRQDVVMLTNLCLVALLTAATAFSVWWQHRQLIRKLELQVADYRRELDTRLRLQQLVAHDIRNPLTVLLHGSESSDPVTLRKMATRIATIIDSARELSDQTTLALTDATVAQVWVQLEDLFLPRLAEKQQRLVTTGNPTLMLRTNVPILCNSVLGNFLSNAIKFSPRGSAIEVSAQLVGNRVRIAVQDQGPGLPDTFADASTTDGLPSSPGTEGEAGTGYGLRIAALCTERLGGSLETRRPESGGAAIAVLLPASLPAQRRGTAR